MTERIPRRIIQTWRTVALPPPFAALAARLRALHPDFEYLLFDDAMVVDFMATHYAAYGELFRSFPRNVQRIDLFRILAIHHFGGFYFDLDIELDEPIDELLRHRCVFPFECINSDPAFCAAHGDDGVVGQYAFGATAGEPFLLRIAENMARAARTPEWAMVPGGRDAREREIRHILYTTGPLLVTRTYVTEPELAREITLIDAGARLDPGTWYRFGRFGRHLMLGSWHRVQAFSTLSLRDGTLLRMTTRYTGGEPEIIETAARPEGGEWFTLSPFQALLLRQFDGEARRLADVVTDLGELLADPDDDGGVEGVALQEAQLLVERGLLTL